MSLQKHRFSFHTQPAQEGAALPPKTPRLVFLVHPAWLKALGCLAARLKHAGSEQQPTPRAGCAEQGIPPAHTPAAAQSVLSGTRWQQQEAQHTAGAAWLRAASSTHCCDNRHCITHTSHQHTEWKTDPESKVYQQPAALPQPSTATLRAENCPGHSVPSRATQTPPSPLPAPSPTQGSGAARGSWHHLFTRSGHGRGWKQDPALLL